MLMDIESLKRVRQKKKSVDVLKRYSFFMLILSCVFLASIRPNMGGSNGVINGNVVVWYLAVPLTYWEAGLICSPRALHSALSGGYLLTFVIVFIYILMPILARIGSLLLTYAHVDIWLLKGMEVFFCMPPPLSVSLVLSRIANADLTTSIVTTLTAHFAGFALSPLLLYLMLGASTSPLVGVNVGLMIYSTIVPFVVGLIFQASFIKFNYRERFSTHWIPLGLLSITSYHWFCDAITVDSSTLGAMDILLCVLIACLGQVLITGLCWLLCSRWLPRNVFLAALFTVIHKSVGFGGWILRGAYHGSAQGSAVNLPLSVLPVAQLLFGSLLACWAAP